MSAEPISEHLADPAAPMQTSTGPSAAATPEPIKEASEPPAMEADEGDAGDLFGEDDEDDAEDKGSNEGETRLSSATPSLPGSDQDGLTSAERKKRKAMEYEEDEEAADEVPVIEVTEASKSLANLPLPASSDGNHWVLKIPSFVDIESQPFDPEMYQGSKHESIEGMDARTKSRMISLACENTIRWRWVRGPDGTMRKQSNSRVIKWSDGSLSLQIGEEIFELSVHMDLPTVSAPKPFAPDAAGPHGKEIPTANNISRDQGLTYLFAQHLRSHLLQAEAAVTGTLTLKPTGMASQAHKKVTEAIAQKHSKTTKLRIAGDLTKEEMERAAEALKSSKRPSSRRRKPMDTSPRKRAAAAITKRRGPADYTDEEGSDESYSAPRRSGRFAESGSKKPRSGEYETDGFLVEDEDEDAGDKGGDSLDEADEAIEQAEMARKKVKSRKPRKASDDEDEDPDADADGDAMDVSDENEPVIRSAGGRKPKRLAAMDSDDE